MVCEDFERAVPERETHDTDDADDAWPEAIGLARGVAGATTAIDAFAAGSRGVIGMEGGGKEACLTRGVDWRRDDGREIVALTTSLIDRIEGVGLCIASVGAAGGTAVSGDSITDWCE